MSASGRFAANAEVIHNEDTRRAYKESVANAVNQLNEKLYGIITSEAPLDGDWFIHNLSNAPPGLLLELGVWEGRSLNEICDVVRPRPVFGFDWFRGLPDDWAATGQSGGKGVLDLGGVPPAVRPNGICVVGLIEDTLPRFLELMKMPITFMHIDVDIYSAAKAGLEAAAPWFVNGTLLLFDEIVGEVRALEHEARAFSEWLEATGWDFEAAGRRHSQAYAFRLLK